MQHPELFLLLVCSLTFFLGSIPFGLLIARMFHGKDVRSQGSGNIGATNVSRVVGFWPAGALTLTMDLMKGALPVFLMRPAGLELWSGGIDLSAYGAYLNVASWLVALSAVLGHCYSPWLYFRGGKGVATTFGALLFLSPWAALAGAVAFAFTFLSTRIGSLSSLMGLLGATIAHLVVASQGAHLWVGAAIAFVILIRHEANIHALLESRENKF